MARAIKQLAVTLERSFGHDLSRHAVWLSAAGLYWSDGAEPGDVYVVQSADNLLTHSPDPAGMSYVWATLLPGLTASRMILIRDARRGEGRSGHGPERLPRAWFRRQQDDDRLWERRGLGITMADANILDVLRKAIELAMPDFRHYYRMVRKAGVVNAYANDGRYYADVRPLRNDETDDPKEPLIPRVEIPIIWGGPQRGVVCPPAPGTLCDLSYYDGDPNYPRISDFRWQGNVAPECGLNELVIRPGESLKIEKDGSFLTVSPKDWTVEIGGTAAIKADGESRWKQRVA